MRAFDLSSIRCAAGHVLGVLLCVAPSLALAQNCASPNAYADYILGQNQVATSATNDMAMNWQSGLVWNTCLQGEYGLSCGFYAVNKSWSDWANAYLPRPFASENLWGVTANQDLIGGGAWRMAYWSELQGISTGCGGSPAYNAGIFNSVGGSFSEWSGSPYGTTDRAWYVDFNSGIQANIDRNNVMPVRLVRGGVPFAPLPSNSYSQSSAPGQVVAFGPLTLNGNGGQAWGGARISGGTLQIDYQGSYAQAIVSSTDTITVLVTAPAIGNTSTATLTLHSAQTFGTDQTGPGNEITQMQEVVTTFSVQSPGFSIGGSVSGLTGSGLVLRNNGGDDLAVSGGTFTFPGRVALGGSYNVTVKTQPVGQTCTVGNGSGSNVSANVNNVAVTCAASTFSIGGSVSGLSGSGLVLQNGSESLPISANGGFTFATKVTYGGSYAVTVKTQPVGQTCTVANGSGSNVGANVTNVAVSCVVNTYSIGGTVSGLSGTGLVLQNGSEHLSISGNGNFVFTAKVAYGGSYSVTIKSQPNTSQICSVSNGSGLATADVSNVQVVCLNQYVIRGSVSGLFFGSTVVLQNGNEMQPIPGGGYATFTFTTKVPEGGSYNVIVKTQPSGQTCIVANGSGSNVMADVNNVAVTCAGPQAALYLAATPSALIPGASSTLTASGGSGSGALTYSLVSGPCSVSGNLATANNVGTCIVRATKAADTGYESATATATIAVQPAPQLTLHLDEGSDFACYGCVASYAITLTNTGGPASTVSVQFSVSQGVDSQDASVACTGDDGADCAQDAGDPLHFTVTLPANSSAMWVLDLPVRDDAAEAAITLDVTATGASPLGHASTLVLFRDGFDAAASPP